MVFSSLFFIGMGSGKEHNQDAIPQDPVIMDVDVTLVSQWILYETYS